MKKSKMLLALLVLSAAGTLASCVNTSTSSSAPAPSTSSTPAPSTSSVAPSTSSAAPSTSSSSVQIPDEITTVMTVAEAIAHMQGTNWKEGQILHVTGVVTEVKYQEQFGSYNIKLEGGFEVYSGKLASGVDAPVVGATITASGMSKIYNNVYEIAYNNTDKISPNIYEVSNPAPVVPTFEVPTYLEYENVSNWEDGKIEANKVFGGEYMTFVATSDRSWTVEGHNKTAEDGTVFTKRVKSGGKTTADGRYINIETAGAAKLVFYAISGSSSETRNVTVVQDWASVGSELPSDGIVSTLGIVGDKIARYEVELADAATYTLHLAGSINFYGFELIDTAAGNQKVEIASLKVVGPDEYRVGGEFDASKYSVYGLSADGKYEHLLEESEYTLGTIDTTVEKTGENALDLEATYVGFESIKGACEIEVWNWYGITVAEDLKALFVVSEGATEFKNGSDIKFTANNPGNILKSVTLTVGGQPKDVTIEDGEFTVEGANGDINLTAATWEAEIVDSGLTNISWKAETALAADWATLKNTAVVDGTKFGDFTYVLSGSTSGENKYGNSSAPCVQLATQQRAQLHFETGGASVVNVSFSGTSSSKTGVVVSLYKLDGTLVATSDPMDGDKPVEASFNIAEAGSYYIAVGDVSNHVRIYEVSCKQVEEESADLTNISWAATDLADWASLKNTHIENGTVFGDFTYVDLADSNNDDKYSNSSTPSIQLASKGRNQLQFATNGSSVVTLKFSGTGSDKTGVTVELYKADGTLVATSDPMDGSSAVEATFNITEAGSYYVCAGQSQHIRIYEISCEQTA